MATVLPAWKLELIEKKRRKEEEERKRAQEEYARNTAIPEWKRSLINRKKDSPPKKESSPGNSIVSQRKSSFSNFRNDGNSDDKSGISTCRSARDVTCQECDEKSTIKGGGTEKIGRRDSDQAKDTTAINNIFDFSNSIENSDDLTSDSRNVAYEHVRRPSVVRLMFENVTATKSDGKMAGDRHKHVSSSSPREAKTPSPGASIDTSPRQLSTQDAPEQSRGLKPEHRLVPKPKADAQNNSGGGQHDAERSSPSALQPGRTEDEMSHATSVKSLRNIFGGARQREKTVSVDDLPKVAGQTARPPPPMKRWSANVEHMLSSQSTEDLTLVHPPLHQRSRSVSLTDIREEHSEEHFKHKHNVASGLEKRLNKLIRQASLSEGEMVVKDDGESQSSEEESSTEAPETSTDEAEDLHHTEEHKYKNGPNSEQAAFLEKGTPIPGCPRDAGVNVQRVEKSDDADRGIEASKDEEEKVARPTRGSVHKLSALFGASIWNGMKKDQTKPVLKGGHVNHSVDEHKSSGKGMGVGSKSDEEEQPQGGLSISIPWLKNKTGQKPESGVVKSKVQPQRVELISHNNAGHAEPQQGVQKNLFNQKYKDTLERSKSADVIKYEANNERTNFTVHHNVPNENKSRAAGNKAVENAAIPVSAIDMPEPEKDDISVSVIDEPYPGVNVSVIDYPVMHNGLGGLDNLLESGYLMSDELSDDGSDEDMEGSYTVTDVDGEEELDEDEDEIPVSCIDDTPPPTIIVVFETAPKNVRSCMRPKNWKNKGKISFKESVVIHDYPSEDCLAAVYDEMDGRTIQNYQPASLTNIEQKIHQLRQQKKPSNNAPESLANTAPDRPEIMYADDGQAFTDSSDSAGALLF